MKKMRCKQQIIEIFYFNNRNPATSINSLGNWKPKQLNETGINGDRSESINKFEDEEGRDGQLTEDGM